MVSFSIID